MILFDTLVCGVVICVALCMLLVSFSSEAISNSKNYDECPFAAGHKKPFDTCTQNRGI